MRNQIRSLMKKFIFIILTLLVLTTAFTAVSADELYTFELSEAAHTEDRTDNCYIDLSIPQIKGLADKSVEEALNAYFMSWRENIVEEYENDI